MHELFTKVLSKRDLSRAGDLFSVADYEIVNDLTQVVSLKGLKQIFMYKNSYLMRKCSTYFVWKFCFSTKLVKPYLNIVRLLDYRGDKVSYQIYYFNLTQCK